MAYANSDEEPFLDKQTIQIKQNGEERYFAALHKGWASNRSFMRYFPYPDAIRENEEFSAGDDIGLISTKEIWEETAQFFIDDLEFLLALPYHKFWSQVVYHHEVRESLTSYLVHAPRCFNKHLNENLSDETRTLQAQINKLVFMVYLRMSTHKESNTCRITPFVFGNLIYDNYLFDIPIIYDLCAIYGDGNKELLKRMIENVFQNQQSYLQDLKVSVDLIVKSIATIEEKFGLKFVSIDNSENISNVKSIDLQDTILYTLDTVGSIFYFLEIYPFACSTFFESSFTQKLIGLYDCIVGFVLPELNNRRGDPFINTNLLKSKLQLTRTCILKIFRLMIETCCLQPLLEQVSKIEKADIIDLFLNTMSNILSDKRFAKDYEIFHPFRDDFDMFVQAGVTFDIERVNYIVEGFQVIMKEVPKLKSSYEKKELNGFAYVPKKVETLQEDVCLPLKENSEFGGAAAASPQITGVKLNSLISQVKDLLSDLGDGFVQMCLDYYNYDVENVINAILEDNLPPNLSDLDRKMNKLEDVVQPLTEELHENTLISQRKNIYDNDKFDVFNRNDVDMANIHKGKKKKTEIVKDEKVKAVTLQLLEDNYSNENSFINVYDDEYDDTYDEQAIAANESLTFDELLERRPFELPRVLGGRSIQKESSDEYEEEIPENKNRDEFIQNPAELRAKAEQRRLDSRTYRDYRPPISKDVKGGAKGQGQSDSVLRNRSSKEKNKSYVGNHNRRALADRKRKV